MAQDAADAAVQRRIAAEDARTERRHNARAATAQLNAEQRQARADSRRAARARVLGWVDAHVIELLIYPIAVLSFALAAPAMAAYGTRIFGVGGFLLAGITELGMWAFAMAVVAARRRYPDRPVLGLQAGVVVFSAGAAGMNLLHGVTKAGGGWETGAVMAVVSVAGIVAHQLTLAGAPRTRSERRAARLAARVAAKLDRARHAAVRDAVTVIDTAGAARLVYRDGAYQLRRRRLVLPTETVESAAVESEQAGSSAQRRVAVVETGGAPGPVDTGAPVHRETAAGARADVDSLPRVDAAESETGTETDGEVTVVLPVVHPGTVLDVEESTSTLEADAGTTKLAQAEALLVQAWDRGEEPTLSEIDRLIGGSRTATNAKRSLRDRGVLPPSERATTSDRSTDGRSGLASVSALPAPSKPA
ncbi:hypothetical protein [Pseudonocardia sp. ICBG601]|uniref:hypothetical protein n=1 Tax=Pseudonocardia sp. ICBG601 TaxID=2846759 RepID=UPI001CF65593|nr:hypothetical protein [Pseudonocardia sp. ICBG601]